MFKNEKIFTESIEGGRDILTRKKSNKRRRKSRRTGTVITKKEVRLL
jgi:hypothetical protein